MPKMDEAKRDRMKWFMDETWVVMVARPPIGAAAHFWADVVVEGMENFPLEGPVVAASNHLNFADVIYWGLHLPRYPIYMAKKELFEVPVLGWVLRHWCAFPVFRGEADAWAVRYANDVLRQGKMLFLFPEAHRQGREHRMGRGKSGMIRFALDNDAPIVPMAMRGTEDLFHGKNVRPKHATVHLRVGSPIDAKELCRSVCGEGEPDKKAMRKMTDYVMRRIADMLPPDYRGLYGEDGGEDAGEDGKGQQVEQGR